MRVCGRGVSMLLLAWAFWAHSADAQACGPHGGGGAQPVGELVDSVPEGGGEHPANAAFFFRGDYLEVPGALSATVNGVAVGIEGAGFVDAEADESSVFSLRLVPEPVPGDAVSISGDACPTWGSCPVSLDVTAGEPDVTPPPAPADLSFDLAFVKGWYDGEGCGEVDRYTFTLDFEAPADTTGGAPVAHRLEVYEGTALVGAATHRADVGGNTVVVTGKNFTTPLSLDPNELCVQVWAIDSAGNAAEAAVACKPCTFSDDGADAAAFPGGTCPAGIGAGGGDAEPSGSPAESASSSSGCGCVVGGGSTSPAWWLASLGLGAALARRRRHGSRRR